MAPKAAPKRARRATGVQLYGQFTLPLTPHLSWRIDSAHISLGLNRVGDEFELHNRRDLELTLNHRFGGALGDEQHHQAVDQLMARRAVAYTARICRLSPELTRQLEQWGAQVEAWRQEVHQWGQSEHRVRYGWVLRHGRLQFQDHVKADYHPLRGLFERGLETQWFDLQLNVLNHYLKLPQQLHFKSGVPVMPAPDAAMVDEVHRLAREGRLRSDSLDAMIAAHQICLMVAPSPELMRAPPTLPGDLWTQVWTHVQRVSQELLKLHRSAPLKVRQLVQWQIEQANTELLTRLAGSWQARRENLPLILGADPEVPAGDALAPLPAPLPWAQKRELIEQLSEVSRARGRLPEDFSMPATPIDGKAPVTLEGVTVQITRVTPVWNSDLKVGGHPVWSPGGQLMIRWLGGEAHSELAGLARPIGLQHPEANMRERWKYARYAADTRLLVTHLNPLTLKLDNALLSAEMMHPAMRTRRALLRHLMPDVPPVGTHEELLDKVHQDPDLVKRYRSARAVGLGPERAIKVALGTHGAPDPIDEATQYLPAWRLIELSIEHRPTRPGLMINEQLRIMLDCWRMQERLREHAHKLPEASRRHTPLGKRLSLERGARLVGEYVRVRGDHSDPRQVTLHSLEALHDHVVDLYLQLPSRLRGGARQRRSTRHSDMNADLEVSYQGEAVPFRASLVPVSNLARIGQLMSNCVGSYSQAVRSGKSVIVLVEVEVPGHNFLIEYLPASQHFRQASGRGNSPLNARQEACYQHYQQYLKERAEARSRAYTPEAPNSDANHTPAPPAAEPPAAEPPAAEPPHVPEAGAPRGHLHA